MFYFTGGINWKIAFACCYFSVCEEKNLLIKFPTQNETTKITKLLHSIRNSKTKINTYRKITSKWHLNYSVVCHLFVDAELNVFITRRYTVLNCILNASVWNSVHFIWIRLKRLYATVVFSHLSFLFFLLCFAPIFYIHFRKFYFGGSFLNTLLYLLCNVVTALHAIKK